jgi:hypothetical protein
MPATTRKHIDYGADGFYFSIFMSRLFFENNKKMYLKKKKILNI